MPSRELLLNAFSDAPLRRHAVPRESVLAEDWPVGSLCGLRLEPSSCTNDDFRSSYIGPAPDCLSCRAISEGRTAEFETARARAVAAIEEAQRAVNAMVEFTDPIFGRHDDLAELIMVVNMLAAMVRKARPEMENCAIAWLLGNEAGVRSIRVGEMKYWGEKEKHVRCLDVGNTGRAAAVALHGDELMQIVLGDETTAEAVLDMIRTLFQEIVSSNGLKEGAAKDAVADGAERQLREAHAADPSVVEVVEGEDPQQALERAVEVAREAAFLTHFEETWPDKLKGGSPRIKLGVANLRFVHRRGSGTKDELEEMERRRLLQEMG